VRRHGNCPYGYICSTEGICVATRECQINEDCCPGQKCYNNRCENAYDCEVEDAACPEWIGYAKNKLCRAKAAQMTRIAQPHITVSVVYCIPMIPCNGKCDTAQVCVSSLDICVPITQSCESLTCDYGFMPVVSNQEEIIAENVLKMRRPVTVPACPRLNPQITAAFSPSAC